MKRSISFILAAVLLLNVMGWLPGEAFAATEVDDVSVDGLPESIAPGAAEEPGLSIEEETAVISEISWVDKDKAAVTAFQEGKLYYLQVILNAAAGYEFADYLSVWGQSLYWDYAEVEVISKSEAKAWFRYSLEPGVGDIALTVTGLEEGAPASGVTLQISENAHVTLEYIEIEDCDTWEPVEGNFVHGKNYSVEYCLRIEDGYRIDDDTEILLNGEDTGWYNEGRYIYIYDDFTTCDVLDVIELTMPEPEIGRKIYDTWPVCVGNTFEIREEFSGWSDLDGEEIPEDGVFQKGHAYNLSVNMAPAEGYVFSKNLEIRINDQVLYDYSPGHVVWPDLEYSFREKITQVALPALPEKLEKGDTLPQIEAPAGAHYTVESSWFWAATDANTSNEYEENVTTVTKDGTYVLELKIAPKKGYEFTGYEIVTVGGKHHDVYATWEGMELYRPYAIGMKHIDRVDISVTEPQVGATPMMPTVDGQNNYWLSEDAVGWGSCETDDFRAAEECERFEAGEYVYLGFDLVGNSGYVFADDLEIYVNGKKVAPEWIIHMGYYDRILIDFGKLRQHGSVGPGDLDGVMGVDVDDAIYLLQHVLMPNLFPVSQPADFDKSGSVEVDDAIYLLQHVLMPELFPLS